MPASTCVWQMDQKVVVSLSIYTVKASNKDQALLMDIRVKDMINDITIIMILMMLEPLFGSPTMCEPDCQLIGFDGQLIAYDGQLIACDGQLIAVYSNSSVSVFQLISQCILTNHFTNAWANFSLMPGLHGKLSTSAAGRCLWAALPPSVKGKPSPKKTRFYSPAMVPLPVYSTRHPLLGLKS